MIEVLVPYAEFEARELGARLHEIVNDNKELLAARHLLGLLSRYGVDESIAARNIAKGQLETNPQHFAVVDGAGDVQGSASIFEGLPLSKQRLPVPAGLARSSAKLRATYPHASHNLHAWTTEGHAYTLMLAYDALTDHFKSYAPKVMFPIWHSPEFNRPWTIEPVGSPWYVHDAIAEAGLHKIATKRFDDGESGLRVPPRSVLYAHIQSTEDSTEYGKLQELKIGKKSFFTRWDDDIEDMASRNPRG